MKQLHMIEVRPDLTALLRFLRDQGLGAGDGDEDLGYGIHAWLAAAFGALAPKPWRVLLNRGGPPRILGYAQCDADQLRLQLREFAEPAVFAVCPVPDVMIVSKAMPAWRSGRRLAFEVLCCPVGRKARSGVEKDLFLIRADAAPQAPVERELVYCEWVRARMERESAATVGQIRLAGFRQVRQTRQTQGGAGNRKRKHILRPHALLRGDLTVEDPEAFTDLLARGIGRHRSFGYGMLLLRPPS